MNTTVHNERGFSLVELLIAMFILGVVSTAAFNFYSGQHQQVVQQFDVTDTQQGLRSTMEEITRKVRLAGYRVYGQNALVTLNSNTWLALQYHDGDSVRTQLFFTYQNPVSKRTDLMMQMDAGPMQVFAEGIDSARFTPGGKGAGTEWVTIDLVAKSARPGFQTASAYGKDDTTRYLYRRLSSVVALRNR